VLARHDGLEVPVGLHELPGSGDVFGDAVQVAVQVHAEQVEGVAACLGDVHDLAAATGRLPHLTSWLAHPSGPSPEEQFGLGLGFLLDGIARCLAGAESPARSDKIGP
jgi:hypothetical protein